MMLDMVMGLVDIEVDSVFFSENMDFKLVQVQQKINQNMTPDVLLCILLNSFELF